MKNIAVWGVLYYLRFFARLALKNHKPTVIGIAGSVGKSSTRNALFAVLSEYFPTKVIFGNSETGVPLGILGIKIKGFEKKDWFNVLTKVPFGTNYIQNTKYIIVEMGIDDPEPPKNMEYLLTIVQPDIAVDLNATATHTMQFEKLLKGKQVANPYAFLQEKIAEEDGKIITRSGCKVGIYNADDPYVKKVIVDAALSTTELLPFGKDQKNSISYDMYEVDLEKTTFIFRLEKEKLTLTFKGVVLPEAYFSVFAPVILIGKELGLSLEHIKKSLETNYQLPKGRASLLAGVKKSVIIDSSYNSSKAAVIEFLVLCERLKRKTKRNVVFLMGDMRELGGEARHEHEELLPLIHEVVDYLYCVGPLTIEYILPHIKVGKDGLKEAKWFENSGKAGEYLKEHMPENALILVKGSQNTIFLEEGIKEFLADKKDVNKLCRQEKYWKK